MSCESFNVSKLLDNISKIDTQNTLEEFTKELSRNCRLCIKNKGSIDIDDDEWKSKFLNLSIAVQVNFSSQNFNLKDAPKSICKSCAKCINVFWDKRSLFHKSQYNLLKISRRIHAKEAELKQMDTMGYDSYIYEDIPGVDSEVQAQYNSVYNNIMQEKVLKLDNSQLFQSEPSHSQLLKSEPGHSQLLKSEPGHSQLLKSEPDHSQLLKSEPGHSQLLNSEPVHSQLLKSEPGHSQLLKSEPCHSQLLKSEPCHSQLLHSESHNQVLYPCPAPMEYYCEEKKPLEVPSTYIDLVNDWSDDEEDPDLTNNYVIEQQLKREQLDIGGMAMERSCHNDTGEVKKETSDKRVDSTFYSKIDSETGENALGRTNTQSDVVDEIENSDKNTFSGICNVMYIENNGIPIPFHVLQNGNNDVPVGGVCDNVTQMGDFIILDVKNEDNLHESYMKNTEVECLELNIPVVHGLPDIVDGHVHTGENVQNCFNENVQNFLNENTQYSNHKNVASHVAPCNEHNGSHAQSEMDSYVKTKHFDRSFVLETGDVENVAGDDHLCSDFPENKDNMRTDRFDDAPDGDWKSEQLVRRTNMQRSAGNKHDESKFEGDTLSHVIDTLMKTKKYSKAEQYDDNNHVQEVDVDPNLAKTEIVEKDFLETEQYEDYDHTDGCVKKEDVVDTKIEIEDDQKFQVYSQDDEIGFDVKQEVIESSKDVSILNLFSADYLDEVVPRKPSASKWWRRFDGFESADYVRRDTLKTLLDQYNNDNQIRQSLVDSMQQNSVSNFDSGSQTKRSLKLAKRSITQDLANISTLSSFRLKQTSFEELVRTVQPRDSLTNVDLAREMETKEFITTRGVVQKIGEVKQSEADSFKLRRYGGTPAVVNYKKRRHGPYKRKGNRTNTLSKSERKNLSNKQDDIQISRQSSPHKLEVGNTSGLDSEEKIITVQNSEQLFATHVPSGHQMPLSKATQDQTANNSSLYKDLLTNTMGYQPSEVIEAKAFATTEANPISLSPDVKEVVKPVKNLQEFLKSLKTMPSLPSEIALGSQWMKSKSNRKGKSLVNPNQSKMISCNFVDETIRPVENKVEQCKHIEVNVSDSDQNSSNTDNVKNVKYKNDKGQNLNHTFEPDMSNESNSRILSSMFNRSKNSSESLSYKRTSHILEPFATRSELNANDAIDKQQSVVTYDPAHVKKRKLLSRDVTCNNEMIGETDDVLISDDLINDRNDLSEIKDNGIDADNAIVDRLLVKEQGNAGQDKNISSSLEKAKLNKAQSVYRVEAKTSQGHSHINDEALGAAPYSRVLPRKQSFASIKTVGRKMKVHEQIMRLKEGDAPMYPISNTSKTYSSGAEKTALANAKGDANRKNKVFLNEAQCSRSVYRVETKTSQGHSHIDDEVLGAAPYSQQLNELRVFSRKQSFASIKTLGCKMTEHQQILTLKEGDTPKYPISNTSKTYSSGAEKTALANVKNDANLNKAYFGLMKSDLNLKGANAEMEHDEKGLKNLQTPNQAMKKKVGRPRKTPLADNSSSLPDSKCKKTRTQLATSAIATSPRELCVQSSRFKEKYTPVTKILADDELKSSPKKSAESRTSGSVRTNVRNKSESTNETDQRKSDDLIKMNSTSEPKTNVSQSPSRHRNSHNSYHVKYIWNQACKVNKREEDYMPLLAMSGKEKTTKRKSRGLAG